MLRENRKGCFFFDFSSFSSCGEAWRVGEWFLEKEPPRPAGTSRIVRDRLSRGGEFTLDGLGGEFSVDVVLCVNFMAYCCGYGLQIWTLEFEDISVRSRLAKSSQTQNQLSIKPIAQIRCSSCYHPLFSFLFFENTF
jgi:hypothetical protein